MVMGVCRQVLNQDHDAEDAFQVTFLTLARRAETIRDRRLLSAWLYEVAYRIAIRARSAASRRRDQEKLGAAMAATTTTPQHENEAAWAELRPVLHDEINRLPDKYRLPIILSYLEGRTNEEVAGMLSWPVGTVKGRLSRARDLLRARLVRRGLVLSAAFLCSALSHGVVFAEVVPKALIDRTMLRVLRERAGMADTSSDELWAEEPIRNPTETSATSQPNPLSSGGRVRGRFFSWVAHVLAAIAILAMVGAVIIFTDPSTTQRFKKSTGALIQGEMMLSGCH
jgi:RNA polymerase sigma factor (sigma-70 family)